MFDVIVVFGEILGFLGITRIYTDPYKMAPIKMALPQHKGRRVL